MAATPTFPVSQVGTVVSTSIASPSLLFAEWFSRVYSVYLLLLAPQINTHSQPCHAHDNRQDFKANPQRWDTTPILSVSVRHNHHRNTPPPCLHACLALHLDSLTYSYSYTLPDKLRLGLPEQWLAVLYILLGMKSSHSLFRRSLSNSLAHLLADGGILMHTTVRGCTAPEPGHTDV